MRHSICGLVVLSVCGAFAGCSSESRNFNSAGGAAGVAGTSTAGGEAGQAGGNNAGRSNAGGSHSAGTDNPGGGDAGAANTAGGEAGEPAAAGGTSGSSGTDGKGGTSGAAGGGVAGGGAGHGGSGGSGGQKCNNLSASGAGFTPGTASGSPPTASYGTIKAGNYRLTSETFYAGNGFPGVGVAQATVSGQTVTFNRDTDYGAAGEDRDTIVVVMGQPNTQPSTSVKVTCAASGSSLAPYVGLDATSQFQYTATGNSFAVYFAPESVLLVYTLQP